MLLQNSLFLLKKVALYTGYIQQFVYLLKSKRYINIAGASFD